MDTLLCAQWALITFTYTIPTLPITDNLSGKAFMWHRAIAAQRKSEPVGPAASVMAPSGSGMHPRVLFSEIRFYGSPGAAIVRVKTNSFAGFTFSCCPPCPRVRCRHRDRITVLPPAPTAHNSSKNRLRPASSDRRMRSCTARSSSFSPPLYVYPSGLPITHSPSGAVRNGAASNPAPSVFIQRTEGDCSTHFSFLFR